MEKEKKKKKMKKEKKTKNGREEKDVKEEEKKGEDIQSGTRMNYFGWAVNELGPGTNGISPSHAFCVSFLS